MTANDLIRELSELSGIDRTLEVEGVELVEVDNTHCIVRLRKPDVVKPW